MPKLLCILLLGMLFSQQHPSTHQTQSEQFHENRRNDIVPVRTGLDILLSDSLHLITNKSVALVTNQTGVDRDKTPNYKRLLESPDVSLKVIFSPEHGLFGEAAAGEKVSYDGVEIKLPTVYSLYGKTRKPTAEMLTGIDIILYDIQDIGARFYTYITTLGLVMEAAGELGIPILVLDRPNPISGDRISGPILDISHQSFVGYYPIPIQYGMTIGELALCINHSDWVQSHPSLTVLKMENWERDMWYDETTLPWIPPSPNIPDLNTAIVYPGMCLLEATNLSEGRGTFRPFIQWGAPWLEARIVSQELNKLHLPGVVFSPTTFTPITIPGMASNPKYENELCKGIQIHIVDRYQIESVDLGLSIISTIQTLYPEQLEFNASWFTKLWGNDDWSEYVSNWSEKRVHTKRELPEYLLKCTLY